MFLDNYILSLHFDIFGIQFRNPILWRFWCKSYSNHVKPSVAKKVDLVNNALTILVWKSSNDKEAKNNSSKKGLHPKGTHCSEAPKSMMFNYFCTKIVLIGTFWEIRSIQIQI